MILLIDNYDSFSYNLYQLIGTIEPDIKVIRNDEMTVKEVKALNPQLIILSPGPGRPDQAGICEEVVKTLGPSIPILGVCLGHQAICEAYGSKIIHAKKLMHGKTSIARLDRSGVLFKEMDAEIKVARYHSLEADPDTLPAELFVTAMADGEIMAVEHEKYPVYGLQFHPESILTPKGIDILRNVVESIRKQKNINIYSNRQQQATTDSKGDNAMIKEAIAKLIKKENLTTEMMEQVMEEIMTGEATDAQKASFLTAMTMKGETIDEITSAAKVMRSHCEKFLNDMDVLEIVGTGGDGANTINISTIASIIVSSTKIPVAKHGNRAASSKCGTADCLEALGVNINLSPAESAILLKEHNMCFLFAQKYHPAMRFVCSVRREIGIRTIFNVLGPLANPAGASMQLLGVYSEALVEPLARVLYNLGVKRAMVVYGQDGMDEISLSAPTTVCEVRNGSFKSYVITPEQFGFKRCKKEDLIGGNPQENAKFALDILNGAKGPKTDAVLLNAGAAIYTAREDITIEDGIKIAREALESGLAAKQLEDFAKATKQ